MSHGLNQKGLTAVLMVNLFFGIQWLIGREVEDNVKID
jgi:hypothetical protein